MIRPSAFPNATEVKAWAAGRVVGRVVGYVQNLLPEAESPRISLACIRS
jgi:hypothetical protein